MKLLGAALLWVILLAVPQTAGAGSPVLHIRVNDRHVALPRPPDLEAGVLMAPLLPLLQAFGATVAWDPRSGVLDATTVSGRTLRLQAGVRQAGLGRESRVLPVPPRVEQGILLGPVAAVFRLVGAYVRLDEDTGVLDIVSQVTGVTWRQEGTRVVATVSTTGPVQARPTVLQAPDRLVVDLAGAVLLGTPPPVDVGGAVLRIRSAQFQVRPYVTRVVFDLARPLPYAIAGGAGAVTITLSDAEGAPAARPPTPAPSTAPPPTEGTPVPVAEAVPPSPGPAAAGVAPEPLALPPLPEFADRPGAFHVRDVVYEDQGGIPRVVISASQPFSYQVHEFVFPYRLAVDIPGGVFLPRRRDIEVDTELVRNIVVFQLQLHPNIARILIHFQGKPAYRAHASEGGRAVVVTLGGPGRSAESVPVPGRPSDGLGPGGSLTPRRPRPSSVIIDPGHGGTDPGAIGPTGLHEADVTLAIAQRTKALLLRQGVPVALTRTDDSTVPLEERPDLAQRYGGVVFVSIHANASRDPAVSGTETYYWKPESQPLAALVQSELVKALGEPDRGIRTADFYVLVNTPMPAVLVEVAFITNPREEGMLRDPAVQERAAAAIARAVVRFLAASQPAAQDDASP